MTDPVNRWEVLGVILSGLWWLVRFLIVAIFMGAVLWYTIVGAD
jgi:hypothetical protein